MFFHLFNLVHYKQESQNNYNNFRKSISKKKFIYKIKERKLNRNKSLNINRENMSNMSNFSE